MKSSAKRIRRRLQALKRRYDVVARKIEELLSVAGRDGGRMQAHLRIAERRG
jgi:hypothetical protein